MTQQRTVVDVLRERTKEQGESIGFVFRTEDHGRFELSWARLFRLSGRFAAVLRDAGLGRGHMVVSTLVNSPERAVCDVAVWMSGAASVSGQCLLADGSDLLHTLRVSRASALLVDPDIINSPWHILKKHVSLDENNNVTSSALKDLKKLFFIRRVEGSSQDDFLSKLEAQHEWFEADDITPDDVLHVFTTSGTTGFSKLVVYTHGDYMRISDAGDFKMAEAKTSVAFNMAPFGWLGGFVGNSITTNGTNINCDVRARGCPDDMPEFIWKSIQEEKCSMAYFSPMYLSRVAELAKESRETSASTGDPQATPTWKLDYILLGGLPVTRTMVEAALTLAHSVMVAYGGTELGGVSLSFVTDSESYVDHDTGPPLKDMTVKIVSQDDEDKVLGVNQLGNILIKGPKKNRGFLNDPNSALSDVYTKDGFYRTQDAGRLDERGHLIVEGRGSDAIMRGLYIFYPTWIESRIQACPGVRDVIITGVPDPVLHEELCACLILDHDAVTLEQVRHFVEKDVLTSENDPLSPRPRYYLEFKDFPVTSTDKPRRKVIKSLAAERLHLS